MARLRASRRLSRSCTSSGSMICSTARQHRIQRRHRLLEDHRDLFAADRSHLGLRQREQIAPFEEDAPADDSPRRLGTSRSSDSAVTLLPLPDSPTTASVSPARISNDTPSTARTNPSSVWKWVLQPFDAAAAAGRVMSDVPRTRRGSSASRSPSPRKLNAMTVRKIAVAGT